VGAQQHVRLLRQNLVYENEETESGREFYPICYLFSEKSGVYKRGGIIREGTKAGTQSRKWLCSLRS
jgi:hypothetical protein